MSAESQRESPLLEKEKAKDCADPFLAVLRDELTCVHTTRAAGGLGDFRSLAAGSDLAEPIKRAASELDRAEWEEPYCADLVGLALSGGGIRSATFNLGIVQALEKLGVFRCLDYLSTVSGGGYLGACISSVLSDAGDRALPFAHGEARRENALFRHLRNNANYLAPRGGIDLLRLPALIVRGIVLHQVALLPWLLLLALGAAGIVHRYQLGESWPSFSWTLKSALFVLCVMVGFPAFQFLFQRRVGRLARDRGSMLLGVLLAAIPVIAFIEVQPWAIRQLPASVAAFGRAFSVDALAGAGAASFLAVAGAVARRMLSGGRVLYFVGALGLLLFWFVFLVAAGEFVELWAAGGGAVARACAATIALLVYGLGVIDLNYTSLHRFYRDRLSTAYLLKLVKPAGGRANQELEVAPNDEQKLSALPNRPYHLINTALNVADPGDEYKRGRAAESFVFSKRWIGSSITGYAPTKTMEGLSRQVNLGTAMAISGAAVAPAMGTATAKPLRFLMAILNVRLNYWLPNPRRFAFPRKPSEREKSIRAKAARLWRRLPFAEAVSAGATNLHQRLPRVRQRAGVLTLFNEMFGRLNAEGATVNLSDGGHFENLGIYELVRRRCRLIIASDAECDPSFQFNGLSEALRMVLIDFGVFIAMDGLDEIRRGDQQFAIGKIWYPGGVEGRLIYLKASIRGDSTLESALPREAYLSSPYRADRRGYDQNPYIARYRTAHPDFPHESTADQFFDEAQFECYRALGYEVAMASLRA